MLGLDAVLFGVLVPALVAGVGLLGLSLRGRGDLGVLFFAAAFVAGYAALFGFPPLPFADRALASLDWLAWLALLGGPVLFVSGRLPRGDALVRTLFAGAVLAMTLLSMYRHHWSPGESVGISLALFALGTLTWASVTGLSRRVAGASVPAVLLVTGAGLAVCAGLTGSAKIAQIAGLVCAALGAAWVVVWIRPTVRLGRAEETYVVALLFALGLNARFYSELPTLDALLLSCAPLAAWVGELPALRGAKPAVRTAARIAAAALPVAVAVTRAVLEFEPDPYGY